MPYITVESGVLTEEQKEKFILVIFISLPYLCSYF